LIGENYLGKQTQKKVGIRKQRIYALDFEKLTLRRKLMSKQAKTLTAQEIRRVLDYVATRKHSERNRAMLLTMFYAGLRVKECAALRYEDVLDAEGKVKQEIRLTPEQTKGSKAGTVFVSEKLRKELQAYVRAYPAKALTDKLFYSQKRPSEGWNSNTLCQFFHHLFKNVGIEGASSHSPRRTLITNLADKGVSVRVLQSIARHANISTTQAYIDVNDAMKRKAIELA
jgi:integrase/recombinase XerD